MEETGKVLKTDDGEATVSFMRTEACKKCGACALSDDGEMLMQMHNDMDAKPGDLVTVDLGEGRLVLASMLAYGAPLAGLLAGLLIGYYILPMYLPGADESLCAVIAGTLCMVAVFAVLKLTEPARRRRGAYMPRAVRVSGQKSE